MVLTWIQGNQDEEMDFTVIPFQTRVVRTQEVHCACYSIPMIVSSNSFFLPEKLCFQAQFIMANDVCNDDVLGNSRKFAPSLPGVPNPVL
jgi:hypothetical protein